MACETLRQGLDLRCATPSKKYFQKIVLINKKDVLNKRVVTSYLTIDEVYNCRNSVYFNLKDSLSGFAFEMNENSSQIFATFEKSIIENIPQYLHSVNIVITGVSEDIKCLFTQLDYAEYFAAAQFYDGTIEIFGFEFGLTSNNYTYDPHNSSGGAVLRLSSYTDALEDTPPLIYKSQNGTEQSDFDNNFEDVVFDINGDFNDDFNNDFNNQ